jgi:hypothetical protein
MFYSDRKLLQAKWFLKKKQKHFSQTYFLQQNIRDNTNQSQAWESAWIPGCPTVSDFFTEDAEMSAFTPPKQTTWKGVDAIKAVCDLISLYPSPRKSLTTVAAAAFYRDPTCHKYQGLYYQSHWLDILKRNLI